MSEPRRRAPRTRGPWEQRARFALHLITPWGIDWWIMKRRNERAARAHLAGVARSTPPVESRYEEIIRFLRARGINEAIQIRPGSMPETALNYIAEQVSARLPHERPVRALHIGNFVGVSLCFIAWLVRERHPRSVVVSIDPNITHRGVRAPQDHTLAVLHHFGLLESNLIIPGYTLEWVVGQRGSESVGVACEGVLANLRRIGAGPFDLVLIDGYHEEAYLSRELQVLSGLLSVGSIVVFDDIGVNWPGIAEAFRRTLEDARFVELGQDGRVGIVQLTTDPGQSSVEAPHGVTSSMSRWS